MQSSECGSGAEGGNCHMESHEEGYRGLHRCGRCWMDHSMQGYRDGSGGGAKEPAPKSARNSKSATKSARKWKSKSKSGPKSSSGGRSNNQLERHPECCASHNGWKAGGLGISKQVGMSVSTRRQGYGFGIPSSQYQNGHGSIRTEEKDVQVADFFG